MRQRAGRSRLKTVSVLVAVIVAPMLALLVANLTRAAGGQVGSGVCQVNVSDTSSVTVTIAGGKCIYTFTGGSNSITPPNGSKRVDFLVVGGGGGGGSNRGGGGGAGGFYESNFTYTSGAVDVTVGAGGAAGSYPTGNVGIAGGDGGQSVVTGGGASFAAGGGGGGGAHAVSGSAQPGRNGVAITGGYTGPSGSGGGASMNFSGSGFSGGTGYSGSNGYGRAGASSPNDADPMRNTGGGGGAGSAGVQGSGGDCNASSGTTPDGGAGRSSSITGSSNTYAAGGGGGDARGAAEICGGIATNMNTAGAGAGGSSIGGTGAGYSGVGSNAVANTGSGGGGGGNDAGGAGSAGVVILSIDATKPVSSGTTSTDALPKSSNAVTVAYTATDSNSVASVTAYYSSSSDLSSPTSCGSATGLSGTSVSGNITCTVPVAPTTTRTYYLYTVATDASGVIEDAPTTAEDSFVHDAITPLSTPSSSRVATNVATVSIGYSATDAVGLSSVKVYYSGNSNLSSPTLCNTETVSGTSASGTSNCTIASPSNGTTYYFYTVATDTSGQVEAVADYGTGVTVTYDTTKPSVSSGPASGDRVKSSGSVSYISTELGTVYLVKGSVTVTSESSITALADADFNSANIAANNTTQSISATGLAEGSYKVYVVDQAGNLSDAYANTVLVDNTAPTQPTALGLTWGSDTGMSSTDGITNSTTPSMVATLSETNGSVTFTATKGASTTTCTGSSYASGAAGEGACTFGTMAAGTWTVTAIQTDQAGNVSPVSASYTVVIDTTAPSPAPTTSDLLSESDWGSSFTDNTTAAVQPKFAALGLPEATGTVEMRLVQSTVTVATCTYLTTDVNLWCSLEPTNPNALGGVSARFYDVAGNVSAWQSPGLTVTFDRTAPTLTATLQSSYGVNQSATGTPSEVGRVYVANGFLSGWTDLAALPDNKQNFGTQPTANTSTTVLMTGLIDDFYYYMYAVDTAGNMSSPSTRFAVDATAPTVLSVYGPSGNYKSGQNVDITVRMSEAVNVTGVPRLSFNIPSTVYANYLSGSGTDFLIFRLFVTGTAMNADDLNYNDTTGLDLGSTSSATIKDLLGNSAALTLPALDSTNSLASTSNIRVDTKVPTVTVTSSPATPSRASTFVYTYTFSEYVTGLTFNSFTLTGTGNTSCVRNLATTDNIVYTLTITGCVEGTLTPTLTANAASDVAGNTGPASATAGATITIDRTAPTITACVCGKTSGAMGLAGTTISVTSNSVGTGYLVKSTVTVSTLNDITSAADDVWNSVNITTASSATITNPAGLQEGNYYFYATDAAGNLSAAYTTGTVTVDNTKPTFTFTAPSVVGPSTTRPSSSSNEIGSVIYVNRNQVLTNPVTYPSINSKIGHKIWTGITAVNTPTLSQTLVTGSTFSSGVYDGYAIDEAGNVSDPALSAFTVDTTNPTVLDIYTTATSGTYYYGAVIPIFITMNEVVSVNNTPTLQMDTGTIKRSATYVSGTGTNTLRFNYTVQAGDYSADLDMVSGANLSTGAANRIGDPYGNPDSNVTGYSIPKIGAATVGSISNLNDIVVDGTVPTPTGVSSASGNQSSYYATFTFAMDVTDFDSADVTNAGTATGCTVSVTATSASVYVATFNGCSDGTIIPRVRIDAARMSTGMTGPKSTYDSATITKDTTAPVVTPSASTLDIGPNQTTTFTVNGASTVYLVNTSVTVTNVASITGSASNLWKSFTYTSGTTTVAHTGLVDGAYKFYAVDSYGNLSGASTNTYNVDTVAPTVSLTAGLIPSTGSAIIRSSELGSVYLVNTTVTVTNVTSITGSGSTNYRNATVVSANTDIAVTMGSLVSGTYVAYAVDAAKNFSVVSTTQVTVDMVAPGVVNAKAVTDGTYGLGSTILFDLNYNEAVYVDTTGGTPVIDMNTITNAFYVSGSGTTALRFSLTVGASDSASLLNIWSGSSLSTGGGTMKDLAGNNASLSVPSSGPPSLLMTSAVVVDGVRPTVSALTATATTKATTFTYTSTFSESVSGIDAADYQITGTATGCTATPSAASGTSITVTMSGCSDGTVIVTLLANSVTDGAGNTGPSSNYAGTTVTVDRTGPTVTFTTPSTPTKATTLTYTVTFNESVSGLSTADFSVSGTATGCVIGAPSASSGSAMTISLTACSAGTVDLTLGANTVSDTLVNTGPSSAVTAATVTRDLTAPSVSSLVWTANPTNATSPTFTLTFSEAITGLSTSDFTVSGTATGCTVSPNSSSGTAIVVTLTGCSAGTVTPTVIVNAVADIATNTGPATAYTGTQLTIDRTAPNAPNAPVMATASDTGSSSSDARTTNTSVSVTVAAPESTGTINVTATKGGTTVTCSGAVSSSSGSCLLSGLSEGAWTVSATFADVAGNTSTSSGTSTFTVDNTAPTVSITSPSGTIMSFPITYTLTFSEAIFGFVAGDLSNSTGTAVGCTFTPASSSGTVINVSVGGCGDGTLALQVNANSVADIAGNTGPAADEVTSALQIDSGPPTVTLSSGAKKNDQSANVRSTKPGTAYLVRSTVSVTSLSDITGAADNLWNSVSITAVNTDTSLSLAGLGDGNYSAYAIDSQNRLSVASTTTFTVDNTAPNAPVSVVLDASSDTGTSSSDGRTNDNTPTVKVVAAENGGTVTVTASKSGQTNVVCTMSGSTVGSTCDLASMVDGTWTLAATQADVAGNESTSVTGSMTIDTVGPTVSNVSTNSGDGPFKAGDTVGMKYIFSESVYVTTTGGTPKVQMETGTTDEDASYASGSGSTTLIFAFVVQPGDTASDLSYTSSTAMSLNGGLMKDAAGNAAVLTLPAPGAAYSLSWNRNMVIDTTAPSVATAVSVAPSSDSGASSSDGITNDTTPTISVTAAEGGGTVTVTASKSGQANVVCTMVGSTSGGTCDLGVLAEGTWSVTVKQSDAAGNLGGSVTITVVIDTSAPTVSAAVQSVRSASSSTVRSSEPGTAYVVSSGVTVSTLADITGAADASWNSGAIVSANTDTGVAMTGLPEGAYKVFAVDVAGNLSSGTAANVTVDDTAPSLSSFTGPSTPNRNATLSFSLTFDGAVVDLASADFSNSGTASGCSFAPSASTGTSFTVTVSSCGEGTLVLELRAGAVADAAGNTAPASAVSASSVTIDRTGPTAPTLTNATITAAGVAVVRVAEVSDVYLVKSTVTVSDLTSILGASASSWNTVAVSATNTDTNLAATGLIDGVYRAYAVDAAGNVSTTSVDTVTVDNTAPTLTISASPSSVASGGTSTITFALSENVSGFAASDVTTGLGVLSNFSGTGTTFTAMFTASSVAGGTANITVAAGSFVDAANNTNAPTSGTVSVASPTGSNQRLSTQSGQTDYIIEQFLTPGTTFWRAPQNVTQVEYLVVGGGGGGGGGGYVSGGNGGGGGGGGAGSVSTGISVVTPGTEYAITVGQGGAGGSGGSASNPGTSQGTAGVGGWGSQGITGTANGGNGGCPSALNASTANCGYLTITHGYGGYGGRNSNFVSGARASFIGGGGGGGAGSGGAGGSTSTSSGGSAGSGTVTSFYGTVGTFGIGGAGGAGAAGAIAGSDASTRGSAGSGGSGGLNGSSGGAGGNGADGMVVIRYAVPSISALDLDASDDSGSSNSDDLTNVSAPTITGTAPVGATVQLSVDGVSSGSACTANSATGVFACDTAPLTGGVHSITATSSVVLSGGIVTSTSTALSVTVDLTAPVATLTTATVNWGETANARSNELGTAYLVKDTVAVTDLGSITSANTNVWNSVAITSVDTDSVTSTSGLISGDYKLYAVDNAGNLSLASTGVVTYVDDLTAPTVTLSTARLRSSQSAVMTSSEIGTGYLVRNTVIVTSIAHILAAPANTKTSVVIGTANASTSIPVNGLLEGEYRVFAVDPAGNLSAPSNTTVYVDLTAPSVMSLTSSSSSYVARTFTFTLTMSELVDGLSGADFTNTGTASSCTFSPDAAGGTIVTVSVTCTSDGTVIPQLTANSVSDQASITGPAASYTGSSVTLGATPTQLVLSTASVGTASGDAFTTQPAVTMKNAQNMVVTGVSATVTATITQVNGTGVLVGTVTAAVDTGTGVATFADLGITGTAETAYTITYSYSTLTPATQSVTVTVGSARSLAMSTQPVGAASGAPFATQPIVKVVDSGGNTVSTATASVSVSSSTGTIGGTRPRVTSGGVATFADLTFSGLASQSHTLVFAASGLTSVTSSPFTVTPGTATQLVLVTQSVGTESGSAFTTQPVLEVRDSGGNRVLASTASVTATVSNGAALEGVRVVGAVGGTATYGNLGISGTAGTAYTITYSSPGLTPAVQSVTPTVGPATRLAVTAQPVGAGAGATLSTQPVVNVVDSGGNVILGSSAVVDVTASGGLLAGTMSITASAGVGTFTDLTFAGTAGAGYRLTFTSFGLQSVVSSDFTVTIGAPTRLAITRQPVGATAGALLATQPTVKVLDAGDNVVSSSTAQITATPSGGVLGGSAAVNAVSGVVSYSNLTFAGTIGTDYTLTFTSGNLASVTSTSFRVGVGAAHKLVLTTPAAGARYSQAFDTQPEVEVQDAGGNRTASTATVTATLDAGTVLSGSGASKTATAANGVATFGGFGIVGAPASYTITYSSGSLQTASQTITVNKADQTITFVDPADRVYGTVPFDLGATSSSGLNVTYSTPSTGVCSIAGNAVSMTGIGVCSITAVQSGNGNYNAAPSVTQEFTITRATPNVTFNPLSSRTYGQPAFNVSATADVPVMLAFVGTNGVCNVGAPSRSGNTSTTQVTITGAGDCTITLSRAQDATYNTAVAASGSALSRTFTVNKAAGSISYNQSTLSQTYDGSARVVSASVNSGTLTITYTGIAPTVYAPSTTPPVNAGSYAVVAVQNDSNYQSTEPATLVVDKAVGAISLDPSSLTQVYSGTSRSAVVASTSPASTPFVVTYTGIQGTNYGPSVFAPTNAGTYNVTAALNAQNHQASANGTLTVGLGVQSTISFINANATTYGDQLVLIAVGGTGTGAMSYAVSSGPCTVNGTTGLLTPTGTGQCLVTATRGSSGNFGATSSAPFTINVARAVQTVEFTTTVPPSPLPGTTYTPAGVASSGLAVEFDITDGDGSVCTLDATTGTITVIASGTCRITASQTGDGNHLAAEPVTQSMVAGRLNQSISFSAVPTKSFGDPVFSLGATASSGRVVSYSVVSGGSTCSVAAGGAVTLGAVGTCVIDASQAGDNVYLPAATIRRSITVVPTVPSAPFLASVSTNDGSVTVAYAVPSSDGGVPIQAYTVVVRHAGTDRSLDVVRTDCPLTLTCFIDGLTNGQNYTVTVTAANVVGSGPVSTESPLLLPILNPTAVRGLTARASDQTIDVAWTPPASLGGGTFTRYEISIRERSGSYQTPIAINDPNATSYHFTGLDNGTGYDVKVVTITTADQTEFTGNTAEVFEMPRTVPTPPRDVTIAAPTGRVARVSWRVPLSDGGAVITQYTTNVANSVCSMSSPVDVVCEISGLTPGSPLSVEVRAVNSVGESQPMSAAINLPDRPQPPSIRSVVVDVSTAVVEWAPPVSDGGQPIVGYLVYAVESGVRAAAVASTPDARCATASTTCQIDNLDPAKKYVFTVRAVNTVGESDASDPLDPFTSPTTTDVPSVTLPRTGRGSADGVAVVSWWLLLAGLGAALSMRRRRRA